MADPRGEVVSARTEQCQDSRRSNPEGNSNGQQGSSSSGAPSPGSSGGRRGRSRIRVTPSGKAQIEHRPDRKGYHSLMSSFGKIFHVEKRWRLMREMGAGAYGFVISAVDEVSSEGVAIKMITRVNEKVQLAKRALREITLLRHFSHENITGLIDVDCSPNLDEIYIFMEPMEADLHQIIKSGQMLTNEHVQYFVYQILRGMKYIHSASVIHRDLKPGNLLVNADCELKICDFGLSRGFDSVPDENVTNLTEYVATRWYRAPEIMLAFKGYNTAIDVWSIGCILAELLLGKPLFKGKDYVDQLNKILDVLGTPEENVISKIGSQKAQAYVRSLPLKKPIMFQKLLPNADAQAIDLLRLLVSFDPSSRLTVKEALEHPWLASYHDESDEPICTEPFGRWRAIEGLLTLEEFRQALQDEIADCRREVRTSDEDEEEAEAEPQPQVETLAEERLHADMVCMKLEVDAITEEAETLAPLPGPGAGEWTTSPEATRKETSPEAIMRESRGRQPRRDSTDQINSTPDVDPVVAYARRSSFLHSSRPGSAYPHRIPSPGVADRDGQHGSGIAFPSTGPSEYVFPARSRTASTAGMGTSGGEVRRKLLRTLSTVSIYESGEGLAGGLADVAPIGKFIMEADRTEEEMIASEMPKELGGKSGRDEIGARSNSEESGSDGSVKRRFRI